MRIVLSDIGPVGLAIKETISLENLNNRMNEGRDNDIIFTSAPEVDMLVSATSSGAATTGKISTKYKQPCGLCADVIGKDLEVDANFIFHKRPEAWNDAGQEYEDDIGISYFEGDSIDTEDLLQEALILALDPYWKPEQLPDKSCSVCGRKYQCLTSKEKKSAESNSTRTLGSLLQNAITTKAGKN